MMTNKTVEEGKTLAIVSYITVFGILIAFFLNRDKKNTFTAFHIRQSLGLWIAYHLLGYLVVGAFNSWLVSRAFWIIFIVLLFYGIFSAIGGKAKPIPLIGDFFQKIFASIGT